jgi:hypothetical protein
MADPGDAGHEEENAEPVSRPQQVAEAHALSDAEQAATAGGLAHRHGPAFCRLCGRSLGAGARFCMVCGTSRFYDPDLTVEIRYYQQAPSGYGPASGDMASHRVGLAGQRRGLLLLGGVTIILALALGALLLYFLH